MDLRKLMCGDWRFSRTASGGERFAGIARFAAMPDGMLAYHEEGRVTFRTGGSSTFFRDYIYGVQDDLMTVYFADMRLFHQVALTRVGDAWHGAGHHLCIADRYATTYRITPQSIAITHDVAGPKKDYRLETDYRPA